MQLVLIIEDDVLLRASMARALGKLPSLEVIEASGVAEATQLIRSLHIHLIVADIELRDGTVLEVLPQLEERRIPVVLVSGHVAEFAARLPSGQEVYAKPLSPGKLGQIITAKLGCGDLRAPFSLADYVQLASMGQHSVTLELSRGSEPVGSVMIVRGEAWSAWDERGEGADAFTRMLADAESTTSCAPPPRQVGPRNLNGSSQRLLLDAARVLDEQRALAEGSSPSIRRARQTTAPPPAIRVGDGPLEPRAPQPASEFERLYALGVDALLAKRYHDAFDTLSRASQIRTTASIDANLRRLREMGFK